MSKEIYDRRIKKTIMNIKEAFFELLEKKSIDKITISNICEKADINRSTFYAHYENYDALLNDLEIDLANKYIEAFSHYRFDKNTRVLIDYLFECVKNNKRAIVLFSNKSTGKWRDMVIEFVKEKTISNWLKKSSISELQANLIFSYISNGVYEIIKMWFESNFTLDENMAKETLENIIKQGADYYISSHN